MKGELGNCWTMGARKGSNALAHVPGDPVVWQESLVGSGTALAKGGRQASFSIVWPRPVPPDTWGFQMHAGILEETASYAPKNSLKLAQELI